MVGTFSECESARMIAICMHIIDNVCYDDSDRIYRTSITDKCPGEQLILTYACETNQDQLLTWDVYVPYYSMFYTQKLLHMKESEICRLYKLILRSL